MSFVRLLTLTFITLLTQTSSKSVCQTDDCKFASSYLLGSVNNSFSPCESLHQYACSNSVHKTIYDAGLKHVEEIHKDVIDAVRRRFDENIDSGVGYWKGFKKFYTSCLSANISVRQQALNKYVGQIQNSSLEEFLGIFDSRRFALLFKMHIDGRSQFLQLGMPRFINIERHYRSGYSLYKHLFGREDQAISQRAKKYKLSIDTVRKFYEFEKKFYRLKRAAEQRGGSCVNYTAGDLSSYLHTPAFNFTSFLNTSVGAFVEDWKQAKIVVCDMVSVINAVRALSTISRNDLLEYITISLNTTFDILYPNEFPLASKNESKKEMCRALVMREVMSFLVVEEYVNKTSPETFQMLRRSVKALFTAINATVDQNAKLSDADKKTIKNFTTKIYIEPFDDVYLRSKALEVKVSYFTTDDLLSNINMLTYNGLDVESMTMLGPRANYVRIISDIHVPYTQFNLAGLLVHIDAPQIAYARTLFYLAHEIGHTFNTFVTGEGTRTSLSQEYRHHYNVVSTCNRNEMKRLRYGPKRDKYVHKNLRLVEKELNADVFSVQLAFQAYQSLNLPLLPEIDSDEEMFYRALTSSHFYCSHKEERHLPEELFTARHPRRYQRLEAVRLFSRGPAFDQAFKCKREPPVCPTWF